MKTQKERYQEYLCSPEWGQRKEAVHERARGRCERCLHPDGYAVHHKTYIRKYHEPLTDLMLVCDECHQFIHGRSRVDRAWRDIYSNPTIPPENAQRIRSRMLERAALSIMVNPTKDDESRCFWEAEAWAEAEYLAATGKEMDR